MKRILKRIVPILLAIVVICSIVWYLFSYDRDFTRDMLLKGARFFEGQGNHNVASWFYNQAYDFADDNEAVAIELAQRFKNSGNYTQAERTLSNAIADGGSAELYIELCKTYVEQDKLLDAVTMLDNIADAKIKAELDALRPKAPTVDREPGFYSEYITVKLAATGGTLYTTTNGEYPSTEDTPSTGQITMVSGDNSVYALVLGDNGLVSPLCIFGYTIGGVIEEVTIQDASLEALFRQTLQLGTEDPIFSNQLWTITELTIPEAAENYEDLKLLTYLEKLTIQGSASGVISGSLVSLGNLTHLTELSITDIPVKAEDLTAIASLPSLSKLTLSGCSLSNIDAIAKNPKLTYLDLSSNSIRDLSPLSFMTELKTLDLSHNALESLNAISSLSTLEILDVSYNSLVAVAPLEGCTGLKELYLNNNAITELSCAVGWTSITKLNAGFNQLTDVSALASCTTLQDLDVSNNALKDISSLAVLTNLQVLNFSRNQVTTLPDWGKSCALVTIDGSYNSIETIASLSGYKNLNDVLMDYNKIKSVKPLAECHNLIMVSVYGNPVSNVTVLTEMGVIVHYTPKT